MNIRPAIALWLLFIAAFQCPGAEATTRLKIVFIIADDLGWADEGFNRARFHETPHIDQLRSLGRIFTDAYSGRPTDSSSTLLLLLICGPP